MQIRNFVNIIRELSLEQIRADAMTAPRILIVHDDREEADRLRLRVFGADSEPYVELAGPGGDGVDPLWFDVIVAAVPLQPDVARSWADLFRRVNEPMPVVHLNSLPPAERESAEAVRRQIMKRVGDRAIAIGRHMPATRAASAERIVSDTARVNGQFALVSNIPAIVPVIGALVAVGADFLVLTKNQLLMVFKLAGVYGWDIDNRWRVFAEMLPVIGAGFVWRTAARQLATLIPFAMGTVPKVVIAYAGTYATGRAAQIYYERGEKLDKEQFRLLYEEALERLRTNPIRRPAPLPQGPARAEPPMTSDARSAASQETTEATPPGMP